MRSYWIGNVTGVVAFLGIMAGAISYFSYINRMPAPAMTVVQQLDEKLRYLRERPDLNPKLIAVGSSITWRHLDGKPFTDRLGEGSVLNGGTALLKVHQTRFLANFYADHFSRLQTLMVMLGPTDFRDCSSVPAQAFNTDDADGYAFERHPSLFYYLKYFSPMTYLRSIYNFQRKHVPFTGEMWTDEYGSGPILRPDSMRKGLRYDAIQFDKPCIDALHNLVSDFTTRGIRPVIVFPPIHPEYRQLFPQTIADLKAVAEQLRISTDGKTQIIDLVEEPIYLEEFFVAVHLQWPAVHRLSQKLTEAMFPSSPVGAANTSLMD